MQLVEIARWTLKYDQEATRNAFSHVKGGSPESCGCADCLNFAAARDRAYASDALKIFEMLGIDSHKESEIWHTHRDESGLHHYGGFFHFVGTIESGTDAIQSVNGVWPKPGFIGTYDLKSIGDDFRFGFTSHVVLVPKLFTGRPVTQLEFQTKVPWLIDIREST